VATSFNGDAIIVWHGYEEGMWLIFGAVYSPADKTWITGILESTSDYDSGINDVKINSDCDAALIYQRSDGVYLREYAAITGWMPAYMISSQHPNMSARAVMTDNIIAVSWINFSLVKYHKTCILPKWKKGSGQFQRSLNLQMLEIPGIR
jgi:hypothetical protein